MIAVLACKLCRSLIRLLGRGGTDFPGRVALKLCPNLLGELAKNVTTVIVTGTNGKTTTSRMIEQSWQDAGISYFANKSGANLLSGVTAEFAVHSTLTGRCKYPYALIEADEAALKFISKYVDAKVIVFTNVFRDQLDRYGEVTHTLSKLRSNLVCRARLNAISLELGLPNHILMTSRKDLAVSHIPGDALEAFVAAIYLDGGLQKVKRFASRHIANDKRVAESLCDIR